MFQQITGDKIIIEKLEDGYFSVLVINGDMEIKYPKTKFVLNIEAYADYTNNDKGEIFSFCLKE